MTRPTAVGLLVAAAISLANGSSVGAQEAAGDSGAASAGDSISIADSSRVGDIAAPADSATAGDSLRAAETDSGQVTAAERPPHPPLFAAYGALDTARADGLVARADGIARGARTPLEPLREAGGVALERFGFLGQSERLLVLGAEGVSLRIAGLPVLPSRSGLAPLGIVPVTALRSARLRRPASDPLLGARGAAGSVDALISTETDAESPPLTSLLAERGPFAFRAYRVAFDRWVGPARANFAYQSTRNRLFQTIDHTRLRETFLTVTTPETSPVPFLVSVGGTRNDIDIVAGEGAALGPRRGTEERGLVVARSGFRAGSAGRARVALKDERLEWRTQTSPALRGRERETGGVVTLEGGEAPRPLAFALWGYAGRVVDEAAGAARGTERVGGTIAVEGRGALEWSAYAGAERVSPTAPRAHAGVVAARALGVARVEATAYSVADHPPRGLFLDGDALRPSRATGVSLTFGLRGAPDDTAGSRAPDAALTILHRWVDDGIFLRASDPFFADPIRETYRDRGVALALALPLAFGVDFEGDYLFLDDDAPAPLPLRARHRGRAGLARAIELPGRTIRVALRAGCEIVGERVDFDRVRALDPSIDLRGQIRLEIENAVLFLQVENLLDRFNDVLPGLYPEGASIHLGATWQLRD